ncbi:MAG: type II toxin-antitoxin system VapC family toxin [Chloroflexi bacterium]|nr:type II toxin-antitoxin system VapC family toxin [Chloroflexota bacterium]
MAHAFFLDSSALVKRYVHEEGSGYVSALPTNSDDLLYVAQIAGVEVVSAIARKSLSKTISKSRAQSAILQFRTDFNGKFVVLATSSSLLEYAMQLAETYALRAYDAVQLATVLTIAKHVTSLIVTFVCADEALNKVAQTEGLAIENPNQHR